MKRFSLLLTDEDFNEFLRSFPDYGERTNLLRKVVKRLVQRAKQTGKIWNGEVEVVTDKLFNQMEGIEGPK